MYIFIKTLIHYRKAHALWDQPIEEVPTLSGKFLRDDVYGFTRGQMLVILTSAQNSNGWQEKGAQILLPAQMHNMTLTNILDPQDKLVVDANGTAVVQMRQDRHPQIYVPDALDPATFGVPRRPAHVRTNTHVSWVGSLGVRKNVQLHMSGCMHCTKT